MKDELQRVATRIREVAEVIARDVWASEALVLDEMADRLETLAREGVPEHIDADTTTPCETPVDEMAITSVIRGRYIGQIPEDDDEP